MENEIKVGEYCRTKYGYISKVTEIDHYIWFDSIIYKESGMGCYELSKVEFKNIVVKHSPNLIDLICEGDYVNGRLVLQVDYKNQNVCLLTSFTDTKANTNIMWYGYEDIKTIVTKEQFESITYKVTKM